MLQRKAFSSLLIVLLATLCISTIDAQRVRRSVGAARTGAWYGGGYRWYGGNPYGVGYVSREQGMAEMIRAGGQAAESYSKAAINNEEARSKYLDNKHKYIHMNREMKKTADKDRQARIEKNRIANEKKRANRPATTRPSSLTDSQLDPHTGKIYWPAELKKDYYQADRDRIDEVFLLRNTYSHHTTESQEVVKIAAGRMLRTLKSRIREIPSSEYLSARRFLELLQNEVRS